MFGRIGTQPFRNVARAPVGESGRGRLAPNVNLVGGKSFTAAKLAALIQESGNKVLTLFPGQKVVFKNPDRGLANRVAGVGPNSPVRVVPSRDLNGSRIEISVDPNAKKGKDSMRLETFELGVVAKLKGKVAFTVSVLPRGAL